MTVVVNLVLLNNPFEVVIEKQPISSRRHFGIQSACSLVSE